MNDQLILHFEQLHEGPLAREFELTPADLQLQDPDWRLESPVTGRVTFYEVDADVVGQGELRTTTEGRCARCLAPASHPITARVHEMWMHRREADYQDPGLEDNGPMLHELTGDTILLGEIFRELVLAEMPDRVYCREDCLGLCPHCGVNLNLEPCLCPPEQRAQRAEADLPEWKRKLKGLRLDD